MKQIDRDNSGEIDFHEFKAAMGGVFAKKYSRQELLSAFKAFDTDNNGYISVRELQDILGRLGRHVTRHDVEMMVKQFDTSGDGKLSFEEFCHLFD